MGTKYYVKTWNWRRQAFTPQKGVRCGPYSLFGLRKALLALRAIGYEGGRCDNSMLIYSEESAFFDRS